ncbi:hypothetical protein [Aquiflexum sp.]|uniref:hypothetical protein n=1 Tax=Aquiflexum sp. TaxID=1872584 RepID=UPI003593C921
MKTLLTRIYQGSRILFYTGMIHFVLIFCFLVLLGFDPREVNHENVWLKPLRFAISIWLFTWTFAWFSSYVEIRRRIFNNLNHIIAACMLIEITLITFQAGRGVASHFNVQTAFDAKVFSVMGAVIGFNAAIVGIWFILFAFWGNGGKSYRTSIIWGVVIFLLGNFSGYLIIRYGWPTDMLTSQSKMPLTGWKLTMKDLKISHALGLHAIQILPLIQWFINRFKLNSKLIHVMGIVYLVLYFSTLLIVFI